MFSHHGHQRTFTHNAWLAIALSSVAGAINASGFFVAGTYTSHVTGHVARFGDELAQSNLTPAGHALTLVFFFFLGAAAATAFVLGARYFGRARFALALLTEACILLLFVLASHNTPHPAGVDWVVMTGMLTFAMGMQNALVTNVSGAVIRTTHLTGVTTDLGIESMRLAVLLRRWVRRDGRGSFFANLRALVVHPEARRAWLHASVFVSFLVGAVAGPLLYLRHGNIAMFAPAVGLLVLAAYDLLFGAGSMAGSLRRWRAAAHHVGTRNLAAAAEGHARLAERKHKATGSRTIDRPS